MQQSFSFLPRGSARPDIGSLMVAYGGSLMVGFLFDVELDRVKNDAVDISAYDLKVENSHLAFIKLKKLFKSIFCCCCCIL